MQTHLDARRKHIEFVMQTVSESRNECIAASQDDIGVHLRSDIGIALLDTGVGELMDTEKGGL